MNSRTESGYALGIVFSMLLSACGSSDESLLSADMRAIDAVDEVAIDVQQSGMFQQSNARPIGDADDSVDADLTGLLLPAIFDTQTDIDLAYAQSGAALVQQLNESLLLPQDINVVFADCGVANAFFVPASIGSQQVVAGEIIMCHELTAVFASFFGNREQAFLASTFVLMHELGHALVDVLSLPVLGIEESYVDGIAAVLLGESGLSEGSVLAGWFFGSQRGTPFFDTHRAGPQRLGDLACWGVGADTSLQADPVVGNLAQQLIESGRDCTREYQQQVQGLSVVIGPNIRGGLNVLMDSALVDDG